MKLSWTVSAGLNASYFLIPVLVSPGCPEAGCVPAALIDAAATATAGTDAASMAERCPGWGFASSCWARGSAYKY